MQLEPPKCSPIPVLTGPYVEQLLATLIETSDISFHKVTRILF